MGGECLFLTERRKYLFLCLFSSHLLSPRLVMEAPGRGGKRWHTAPPAAAFPSWFTAFSQRNAPKHPQKNPTPQKTQTPVLSCNALPTRFDHRYGLGGGGGGIPEGRVAGAAPARPQATATRSLQRGGQEGWPGGRWPQGGPPQRGGRAAAEAEGGGGPEAALLPAAAGGRGGIFLQRFLGGLVRSRLLAYSKRNPKRTPPPCLCGSGRGGG